MKWCIRSGASALMDWSYTESLSALCAGLLSHLASCRRRMLLARSEHATLLPPAECPRLFCSSDDSAPDENSANCVQSRVVRQMRAEAAGQPTRSPLTSIDNVMQSTAAETGAKTKPPQPQPSRTDVVTDDHSNEQTFTTSSIDVSTVLQSNVNSSSQQTDSSTSRDVMDGTGCHGVLSLATDDDNVTSSMWRPW